MMPDECPFCGNPLSTERIHEGFVYCRNAHVLTLAPLHQLDPQVLVNFACAAATQAMVDGGSRVDRRRIALWRARVRP